MRNKVPFFLSLIFFVMMGFVLNPIVRAQTSCDDKRKNKQERKRAGYDDRGERVVVARSANQVYRSNDYYANNGYYENGSPGSIAQIARLKGFYDGLHEGAKDARDGDRFDPFGEWGYKDGAGGYRSNYGNKDDYKRIYRQGFLRGYREAFNRYLGGYAERNW